MPVNYIERVQDMYATLGHKPYRWVVNEEPPPWKPLSKPLCECRLGLIGSGGIYVTGQVAFHYRDDTSFRMIPRGIRTADLRVTHFAYDLTNSRQDPNVVFPIDSLRRLVKERVIGELADHSYSFMGGIYSPTRVRQELAPRLAESFMAEKVEAVLLVPV